jgi:hypothetical protein
MVASISDRNATQQLEQAVERQVRERTWGRIHRLCVDASGGRLEIRGQTSTYYLRQLALQAVLDVLNSADAVSLDFDIQVASSHRPVGPRWAPEP